MQKGLYRPASWIKGILLPFAEMSDSTLKQAQIISAAIMKTPLSNVHAGAAIYELLDKPYSGPLNVILKVFIDKKLSLPQLVVQKLVDWFMGFKNAKVENVPVLWFQTLLNFCKLYKSILIRIPKRRYDQKPANISQKEPKTRTAKQRDKQRTNGTSRKPSRRN